MPKVDSEREYNKLLHRVTPQLNLYTVAVLRVVACKVGEQLVNVYTQARLGYNEDSLFSDGLTGQHPIARMSIGPLYIFKTSMGVDPFVSMPKEAIGGSYAISTHEGLEEIVYGSAEASGRVARISQSYRFETVPPEKSSAIYGVHLNLLRLYAYSGVLAPQLVEAWDQLETKLKERSRPFRGVEHLIQQFMNTRKNISRETSPILEFIALPADAFGDKTNIRENVLTIHLLRHPATELSEITFGLIEIMSDSSETGRTLKIGDLKMKEGSVTSEELILTCSVENVIQIQLFARYRGSLVDEVFVLPEKPAQTMVQIHEYIDKELKFLHLLLSDRSKSRSDRLELGVAWLLGMLGFITIPWGLAKDFQDAPDGIAFIPDMNVGLVYECMTDQPNSENKLAKLRARSLTYQNQFPEASLLAVLFTSSLRQNLPSSLLINAAIDQIAVVCLDEMELLLERIGEYTAPLSALEFIRMHMPKSQ